MQLEENNSWWYGKSERKPRTVKASWLKPSGACSRKGSEAGGECTSLNCVHQKLLQRSLERSKKSKEIFFFFSLFGDHIPKSAPSELFLNYVPTFCPKSILWELSNDRRFFSRINETFLFLIIPLSKLRPVRAMKVGILTARKLSIHSWEFWRGTQVLSTQGVHFSLFNCFLWLLPENGDHSHLDEEGEMITQLLKPSFWQPLRVFISLDTSIKFCWTCKLSQTDKNEWKITWLTGLFLPGHKRQNCLKQWLFFRIHQGNWWG